MKKRLSVVWMIGMMLLFSASLVRAQSDQRAATWQPDTLLSAIISTVVFGLIGIVLAILGFKLFDALTPFNLEKEICEKQNFAVAILCGGMILGICIIIAAVVL